MKKKRRLLREKKRAEKKLYKLQREEGINLPEGTVSQEIEDKLAPKYDALDEKEETT